MANLRQRNALKNLVANGGNIAKAMRDAGYSPRTARTPQKLTESNGWQKLLNSELSDAKLLRKHNQLLNAKSENVQLGALDVGYKLKARYTDAPELTRPMTVNVLNFYEAPAIGNNDSPSIQAKTVST